MEKAEKLGKRSVICGNGYLTARNYAEFLLARARSGGLLGAVMRAYRKIRKYTLFTAVIRGIAVVIALLEKSAILLLLFSAILLLLPLALIPFTVCAVLSIIGYFRMNAAVKAWVSDAERITVYVTDERFFGKNNFRVRRRRSRSRGSEGEVSGGGMTEAATSDTGFVEPLFARCAAEEASDYSHPVIVVCSDRFLVARWVGFNLLAVKCDYFFILRRFYFSKKSVSYVVLC